MTEAIMKKPSGYAALQEAEGGVTTISGVALGANDVTRGMSGILKRWPADTLRDAADTLADKPLVVDHSNHRVEDVKGRVTKAGFKEGVGVIFEGEIESGDLTEKIGNEWLDVSPRILHEPVEEMQVEGEGDDPVHVVGEIEEFVNLSLVPRGAAPSNEVQLGEHEDLSAEDFRRLVVEAISESLADGSDDEIDVSVDVTGTADEVDVTVSSDGAHSASERILSEMMDSSTSEEETVEDTSETDSDELGEHTVHEPEFSGSTESSWSKPALEDFTDESWEDLSSDEKSDVGDHFIGSKSGFPAESFGDHFLPVVESDGDLNLNALQNAKARVGQVQGLSDEDQSRAETIINRLAEDNFDADFEDNADGGEDDVAESVLLDIDFLGDDDSRDETSTREIAELPILN